MRRALKTLALLGLLGFVLTTGLPLVQAHGTEQVDKLRDAALGVTGEQNDATSVGALLGNLQGIDITDQGLTIESADGQSFNVNVDLSEMTKAISQPSGNGTNDVLKYGAMGVLATRSLRIVRSLVSMFLRLFKGPAAA